MQRLTRQQMLVLIALTVIWGFNWPIMKLGVTGFPPLTFRAVCFAIALPAMWLGLRLMKVPLALPRQDWGQMVRLSLVNCLAWHACIVLAVGQLSSGRAAVLGYTMPIFSAVMGALMFGERLTGRAMAAVAATGLGVLLLLWNEASHMAGKPAGVLLALVAAAFWALGTQIWRRHTIAAPTLALTFWMLALTGPILAVLATLFEHDRWVAPSPSVWFALLYNGLLVIAVAQSAWQFLSRVLPPVASSISVMMIPILGVFSGAWLLNETLLWQDWSAVALIVLSVLLVLVPSKPEPQA
ncbi:EamA family transporter [Comamonas serinivorans]|uniref:EamA family transporter n=1 Tax=Comamonas serinivorans TaxID=1082851 RepID=A0A1Y0EJ29_9BURK|nr:EamA family transporter [Comamonas serinivorans]ARU03470.1 EamA family transporter [Comamonas serinivorans]